jgi:CelD/BcsL family acetyltransferase involved in cellulose biosynthesis
LKRHVDLVDALARLANRHPTLRVLFLGTGPHEDVFARAREKGVGDRIHVHYVSDGAIPCVKELEIGVLCSESEGFSNAILEYMGCGLPVVATAVGGNPELVEDGRNGFLFEVGDAEKLAKLLDALLGDGALAARLGAASRARVEREFALDRMVAGTIAVYERALARLPVGGDATGRAGGARPTVEVIDDRAALDDLADTWRAMRPPNGFFVGPDWVLPWLDHAAAGATPHVLAARDADGRLVGVLPLARRGARLTLPGADDGADHLDLAATAGRADDVADAILDHWLATRPGRLELRHLAEDGALRRALRRRRWALPYAEALSTRCPYIAASGTFDDYLARFSAKHRGNLRRQIREVREHADIVVERTTPASVVGDVDELFALHHARFDRFGGRTSFGGERIRRFHHALAKRLASRGELAMTRLLRAGRPIAAHYGFRVGGKLYHFQGGFDPDAPLSSPGTTLTSIVLEDDVFRAGLSEYDFLDGTEPYKLSLATGERRLYDVRLYRSTFFGRARALGRGALHLVRRLVGRKG